jgi:hypothetical protein
MQPRLKMFFSYFFSFQQDQDLAFFLLKSLPRAFSNKNEIISKRDFMLVEIVFDFCVWCWFII